MIIVRVQFANSKDKPVISKEVTLVGSGAHGRMTKRTDDRGDATFGLTRGRYDVYVGGKCFGKNELIADVLHVPWPF